MLFEHHAIIYKWDLKTYTMSFVKIGTQPIFLIQDLTKWLKHAQIASKVQVF